MDNVKESLAISKVYSGRKWAGFSAEDDENDNPIIDPTITTLYFNMYNVFDRIGEGVICSIQINEDGDMVLSFDKKSVNWIRQFKGNVEEWLNAAYTAILDNDVFSNVCNWSNKPADPKDCVIVDVDGKITCDN